MIRTYSQRHRTDKYSQHSSIIWPIWLNGWVFVYELSGCTFESSCSHLNFRFRDCFEQRVPWHWRNYRVWIHSERRTWHDNNIQSNAPYRKILITQLNHLASLAKWLNVPWWIKWLWVRVQLQSLKFNISPFFGARSSLTFRQLRVWIHSETRTWHDKNIQPNAPYR